MSNYKYECFIADNQKFGLLDGDGCLRCTSPDIDGVMEQRNSFGWGTIIRIKVTKKGIEFLKKVKMVE